MAEKSAWLRTDGPIRKPALWQRGDGHAESPAPASPGFFGEDPAVAGGAGVFCGGAAAGIAAPFRQHHEVIYAARPAEKSPAASTRQ